MEVVQWCWESSDSAFTPLPLFNERCGLRTPAPAWEVLPERPVRGLAYGLDSDGDVVLVRRYDGVGVIREEARASVEGNQKLWRKYASYTGPTLEFVGTVSLTYDLDGALVRSVSETRGWLTQVEEYERDSRGRIVRIKVESEGRAVALYDDPLREEYVVLYGDGDDPLTVTEIAVPGGVMFDRNARPLARDLKYVTGELVEGIAQAVVRIGSVERVRCVVLRFETGGSALPLIGIGVASEPDLWDPADFRHALGVSEAFRAREQNKFSDACRALERGWIARDDDEAPLRLGYRVAHELNGRAWRAGTVSEEFVAIAVDETLDHFVEQAQLSAPAEKIAPILARHSH